ncbi:hypothetical protein A6R68_08800, partial [Neotoma lepida]
KIQRGPGILTGLAITVLIWFVGVEDALSLRSLGSHRSSSKDITGTHWSRASTPKRRDMMSGLYFDQRNYSSLRHSKPASTYYFRSSSLCSDPLGTSPSKNRASLYDGGLYNPYGSRTSIDDDTASIVSSERASRGRRDSVVSAADYFSRSNRRGSVVSEVDDAGISDLTSLDEKSDKQYAENYTRPSSRNSASATTPLSGNSSRRGSGDTSSLIDPDTSLSELRESLSEVEEKYKKAMVSNAQLDNEKNNLIYQVDTLKDVIEEQEEQMAEFYRENEEKSKVAVRLVHHFLGSENQSLAFKEDGVGGKLQN